MEALRHPPLEGAMSSSDIRHVTDDTFDPEVLKSDTPVLVDYWAEWCGPCKSIAPMLDEVAKEYEGRPKIAKINVDENQRAPAKVSIRVGMPRMRNFAGTVWFSRGLMLAIFRGPSYSLGKPCAIGRAGLQ